MQARLKVVQDNANLKQVKLLPITVIGRGAECHLKIASTQVSRKHCRITVTDNEVLIEDLTSSNGTFVDQEKIPSGKPIVVAPGAKLQVGPATFIVDYTPPVNLETMPTTVIKASELSALKDVALSKPPPSSETSIPTIDPFAAAVADGTAPTGVITPFHPPEVPLPEMPESFAAEQTVHLEAPAPAAAKAAAVVEPAAIADPMASADSTITPQAPVLAPPVVAQAPISAPVAAPIMERPVINVVEQPALVPAAVVSAPPLVAAPIAPPTAAVAAPIPVAVVPVATAVAAPVAAAVPAPPPAVAASVSEFDFLGGASSAAVEPAAFNAFQFDVAAPAPLAAPVPTPTESGTKPAAAKKPLFGLFGKKEKAAAPPTVAPAAAAPATAAPIAPPSPSAGNDPFNFAPPAAPVAAPEPPPIAPPPAEPVAAPPAEADDPFAFLR